MERATRFQKPASRQIVRIRASWRATVRRAQPSRAAIASSVYPSIRQTATFFKVASSRASSSRRYSSAMTAAASGVGSEPTARARTSSSSGSSPQARHVGGVADQPAAPLEPMAAPGLGEDLARGDQGQKPPEVVAVGQGGELPPRRAGAEAVEGAQGRILLVAAHVAAAACAKLLAGQAHHPGEVTLPELLRRRLVPRLEPANPARDRALVVRHHRPPLRMYSDAANTCEILSWTCSDVRKTPRNSSPLRDRPSLPLTVAGVGEHSGSTRSRAGPFPRRG